MKANDIEELKDFVSKRDIANMFHVYEDSTVEETISYVYNVMKSVYLINLKDIPKSFFQYYEVMDGDTWPLIAHKLYGSVELWWIILKMNDIKDPTFEPTLGDYVRYISKDDVNRILDTLKTSEG